MKPSGRTERRRRQRKGRLRYETGVLNRFCKRMGETTRTTTTRPHSSRELKKKTRPPHTHLLERLSLFLLIRPPTDRREDERGRPRHTRRPSRAGGAARARPAGPQRREFFIFSVSLSLFVSSPLLFFPSFPLTFFLSLFLPRPPPRQPLPTI